VVFFPPAPFFVDDFEGTDNWTHGGTGDSWARGTPTKGPGAAHSGANCWATGLSAPYENNTMQWLRSPAINLTSATAATLEFWEFRDVEPLFGGNPVDWVTVSIKSAADPDGAALVQLAQNVGSQTQWTKRSFALPSEALGKNIIVEFMLTSDDFQPTLQAGWLIDDVTILPE
jgi:bacillopeptidase F